MCAWLEWKNVSVSGPKYVQLLSPDLSLVFKVFKDV